MKKQLIAAAVASLVAAPAAFADVKIKGQINTEWFKTDGGDLSQDLNSDIVFAGSEDLGNGLSAFFTIASVQDAGAAFNAGGKVFAGLKGSFGKVSLGKQEMLVESQVMSMAANDASDSVSNEVTSAVGATANSTIIYTSNSMNGVKVGLGARAEAAGDDLDKTEIMVEYKTGGLLLRAAAADDNGVDTTGVGAKFTMGDWTVGAVTVDENNVDESWVGASYKMGNNTLALSTRNSDTAANEDTIVSLKHSLSKRTSVYAVFKDDGGANSDVTLVGMKHTF
tara:strand:+ start:44896 stop:45738 length:843 start_codon:yes stop_codon:yes gene_type:complete